MIFKHIPTGNIYNSRKEAKDKMGHSNFNKALKNFEIQFWNYSQQKFMTKEEFGQFMEEEKKRFQSLGKTKDNKKK